MYDNGIIAAGMDAWTDIRWKHWIAGPMQVGNAGVPGSISLMPPGSEAWIHMDNRNGTFRMYSGELDVTTVPPPPPGNRVNMLEITPDGRVGMGTTPVWGSQYRLSVNGSIRAKEIIVETGWADYVFSKDYKLSSLSEIEQHIAEKGHLPGIPSEAEIKEKGVNLGEMQAKLLEKIEEMTLRMIEQEKTIQAMRKEIQSLKTDKWEE